MKDEIQKSLDEVIAKEIDNLPNIAEGSKEKKEAIENLEKLYKLRIEEAKIEQVRCDKIDEMGVKQAQLDAQARDRWINFGTQIGLAFASLVAYNMWFNRGLKFEETGTITSPITRNLLSRLLPKK